MTTMEGLAHGLAVALQPGVLIYSLLGAVLGTLVGVLPGIGAMAAITLLLPITYYISSEAALVMLAAVYYGAQYGGAVASILLRLPGTPQSASITAFVPTLTLGIPGDPIMALMLGALVIHGIQPGPMMLEAHPDMFWGLVVSFGIGNLFLLVLNLPLIGIWVSMLRIPFRWLYPAIIIFVCLGVYSVRGSTFDIVMVAAIGAIGYALTQAAFSPALLLLGFVLGPLIETNLRRALLVSRGDP